MTARDEILRAIRDAVDGIENAETEVDRSYRVDNLSVDTVALFIDRVSEYTAVVHRCAERDLSGVVGSIIGDRSTIVPPNLEVAVDGATADAAHSAPSLDMFEAVVTCCAVAIAETGTIVLDHGPGQGRRALSLVPDMHVCIVMADQVLASVVEAVAILDPNKPSTWISGPSATSDIELERVEGVHGPRKLHVIVVDR